jgi:phospholipase/lecithinase/hemolysin
MAAAQTYSAVIAYGDSYSDNGNLYHRIGEPGWPYWRGRASNGPVAVEKLAGDGLGHVPLIDDAWGGATTGIGDLIDGGSTTQLGTLGLPGMTTQFNDTKGGFTPAMLHSALFFVWGSINDFGQMTTAAADQAVANLVGITSSLQKLKAQFIFVPGIPDMGLLPYYRGQGPGVAARASFISNYFNQKLAASLPKGVLFYDTAALFRDMVAHPGSYGLSNVTDPCYNGQICAQPYQYLFWDGGHPSAHGHQILGQKFAEAVLNSPAVDENATAVGPEDPAIP